MSDKTTEKIRNELLAIQRISKDGMLHAEKAVAWAQKNKTSALHRQLEWNNSKAAHEFRIWQVRRLIQLHVVMTDGSPQLVSLSFDRTKGGGYRGVDDVISSKELSEVMLRDALADLERMQAKYARVRELTSVWTEVKRVQRRHVARARVSKSRPLAKAA